MRAAGRQRALPPAFLVCVAVLGAGILGLSVLERALGLVMTQTPLPLVRPLADLDRAALAPYRVRQVLSIDDPDLLAALGTRDYVQWVLEDPRRGPGDPAREVLLFITYYPRADRIPHVPEECYLGSGFQRLATERLSLQLPGGNATRSLAARRLVFARANASLWSPSQRVPVVYLFHVNGSYAASRDEARLLLNANLFGGGSYFSKVELVFNRAGSTLTGAQTAAAAQEVLAVVLPLLERDHWPTWPPVKTAAGTHDSDKGKAE